MKRIIPLMAIVAGCHALDKPSLGERRAGVTTSGKLVKTEGGTSLATTVPPDVARTAFVAKLKEYTAGERLASATHHCRMFPDLTRAAAKETTDVPLLAAMAAEYQPYEAAHAKLQEAEKHRKAGKADAALAAWEASLTLGAMMLTRPQPVIDPAYWQTASAARPIDAEWPPAARMAWAEVAKTRAPVTDPLPDAALWTMIGIARLDRGESQAALTAFKRAETLDESVANKAGLTVLQAKALAQFDQHAAAMTLLVPLAVRTDTPSGAAAAALVGSLKLAEGGVEPAIKMLQQAVETSPLKDWPGRAEAEADLGLAYLSAGNSAPGLNCLHSAQQSFLRTQQIHHLIQSMDNEARYYSGLGQLEEQRKVKQTTLQIEKASPNPLIQVRK